VSERQAGSGAACSPTSAKGPVHGPREGNALARWALTFLLTLPLSAWPHATQLSSARIELTGSRASVLLELNGRDLEVALKIDLLAEDGSVDPARLQAAAGDISAYALQHARLANSAGGACQGNIGSLKPQREHVLVEARWRCPPLTGALVYRATLFQEIDAAARHMVSVSGEVRRIALLSVASPETALAATRAQLLEVLWHYMLAGIEHIAIGYDHIAFLVALILWGRRIWPLVGVVTAFTVAHSLTLTLAVLEVLTLPQQLVEVLIALSVVYVAAENFFVRDIRHRWWLTFLFGLVHGFGFASVLRDYGIPRDALLPALAAFNLGVEVGQVVVVLAALVALTALAVGGLRREPDPRFVRLASGAILLVALYWTAQRVVSWA
jgi:hydrogenase/urease accessory protein HupE